MKKLILSMAVISMITLSCKDNANKEAETEETQEEMAYETTEETTMDQPTIVEIAVENDNFSTLETAVKAADLVETLNSEGPFTVFAPTNAAFDKLPAGTVESLLKPENKEKLKSVLTYHVVSGEFKAVDVINAIGENNGSFTINTVQGGTLTASLEGENVVLTDANGNKSKVVLTDVDASNGIIHAIDTVVMPKS